MCYQQLARLGAPLLEPRKGLLLLLLRYRGGKRLGAVYVKYPLAPREPSHERQQRPCYSLR